MRRHLIVAGHCYRLKDGLDDLLATGTWNGQERKTSIDCLKDDVGLETEAL